MELLGFVTHKGVGSYSGHYVATVKRDGNKWYHCDDDHITEIKAPCHVFDTTKEQPYLILYRRHMPSNAPPVRQEAPPARQEKATTPTAASTTATSSPNYPHSPLSSSSSVHTPPSFSPPSGARHSAQRRRTSAACSAAPEKPKNDDGDGTGWKEVSGLRKKHRCQPKSVRSSDENPKSVFDFVPSSSESSSTSSVASASDEEREGGAPTSVKQSRTTKRGNRGKSGA